MNKERALGFVFILAIILFGMFYLESSMLFFRLFVGVGLGYALTRGYTGFAGSINRAYKGGSTALMRTMMLMFFITALMSVAVLFNADASSFDLWVNPINLGLILGGLLFGFGMAGASCCASGVLTDLVTALPRGLITLIFFSMGVFLGFPLQFTQGWIQNSWLTTETGAKIGYNGVYFPDLFKGDGFNGYLGALLLTAILCGIVVYFARKYENYRRKNNTFGGCDSETMQCEGYVAELENSPVALDITSTYERVFVKPWSLKTAAVVISIFFTLLMGVTKAGWGASMPYGFWFGKVLHIFGVSGDSLAAFTHIPPGAKPFVMPFFDHPVNVQNVGIILGTIVYLLTAGIFSKVVTSELKITGRQVATYAFAGLCMGFGTRFANGCNVGALYTPIANFSLSGWVFFVFLVLGGIAGNKFFGRKN